MKRSIKMFGIASLAIALASLAGCASQGQKIVGSSIVGDTEVFTISAWDNDPATLNAKTLTTLTRPAPPKQEEPCTPCKHRLQAAPCRTECAQEPRAGHYVWVREPAPETICRERVVVEQQVQQEPVAMRPAPCTPKTPAELTTKVVNSNNVGGDGIVNNFFKEGFAGVAQGAGIAGAGCLLSHAHWGGAGGAASSSSSSSSAAASAASSD